MLRRTSWFLSTFLALSLFLLAQTSILAQTSNTGSTQGRAVFRSNCAFCHGADGKGGRGPSLLTARTATASNENLGAIIRNGIAGTSMPAFGNLDKDELDPLLGYIHELAGTGVQPKTNTGDAALGAIVYKNNGCAGCHRIGTQGSVYGPELSRVGSGRSLDYLRESIANPSADIPEEFEGVSVTSAAGRKVTGLRVNEDTFTVQLRLPDGKFASFDKTAVKSVEHMTRSVMPAYKLPAKDMDNLLAYLETLRSAVATGADAEKAKGIK